MYSEPLACPLCCLLQLPALFQPSPTHTHTHRAHARTTLDAAQPCPLIEYSPSNRSRTANARSCRCMGVRVGLGTTHRAQQLLDLSTLRRLFLPTVLVNEEDGEEDQIRDRHCRVCLRGRLGQPRSVHCSHSHTRKTTHTNTNTHAQAHTHKYASITHTEHMHAGEVGSVRTGTQRQHNTRERKEHKSPAQKRLRHTHQGRCRRTCKLSILMWQTLSVVSSMKPEAKDARALVRWHPTHLLQGCGIGKRRGS